MQNPRRSKSGGGFSHERSNLNPINPPEPTRSSDAEVKCFLDTYAQGRIAEAAEFAKTLTERHPQDGFGWKAYGAMLQVLGQTAQAVAAMEHAARLLPDDPEAHNNLGTGYKSLARLEDSEASYRRALALSPEFPEAWCNLGLTLATLGRHAEALASFERADALKPDWPKVASGKCFLFYEMGRFSEAEALATAALEAGRWDINTFGILASLRRMTAADRPWLEQAEAVLKQGLIPYHELGLRYLMGKFCDDIGEHDRAFAHYQIANRLKRALKGHWNRDYWAQRVEQEINAPHREVARRQALLHARDCARRVDTARSEWVRRFDRASRAELERVPAWLRCQRAVGAAIRGPPDPSSLYCW